MFNNTQAICAGLGKNGCLLLCYIHVAEKIIASEIDVLRATLKLAQLGYIELKKGKELAENAFTVNNAEKVIETLTGLTFSVIKVAKLPKDLEGAYVITEYTRHVNGKTIKHYSCKDYKPLADSLTEKYGDITGYRVVTNRDLWN